MPPRRFIEPLRDYFRHYADDADILRRRCHAIDSRHGIHRRREPRYYDADAATLRYVHAAMLII